MLEAGGQRVTREYYFNDSGSQVASSGRRSSRSRRGEPVPEDGYRGDYVRELAAALPGEVWAAATRPAAPTEPRLVGRWASERVRAGIEASLEHLGVHFDVWKTEGSLHDDGWVERAVERLRAGGHVYEQDGATWFRSTAFGDDKDRVIIRSNGEPTYFAADIGYVDREVQPRLRRADLHLGRRPPRHGRPGPQRGRGDGLRPRSAVEMLLDRPGSASSATASRSR